MQFYVFHGRQDKIMRVEPDRKMVVMLTEAGAQVEYKEYEDVGHEASVFAYADGNIIQLFRK
jgi:predicted esterase